jgi:hypothetical protein
MKVDYALKLCSLLRRVTITKENNLIRYEALLHQIDFKLDKTTSDISGELLTLLF